MSLITDFITTGGLTIVNSTVESIFGGELKSRGAGGFAKVKTAVPIIKKFGNPDGSLFVKTKPMPGFTQTGMLYKKSASYLISDCYGLVTVDWADFCDVGIADDCNYKTCGLDSGEEPAMQRTSFALANCRGTNSSVFNETTWRCVTGIDAVNAFAKQLSNVLVTLDNQINADIIAGIASGVGVNQLPDNAAGVLGVQNAGIVTNVAEQLFNQDGLPNLAAYFAAFNGYNNSGKGVLIGSGKLATMQILGSLFGTNTDQMSAKAALDLLPDIIADADGFAGDPNVMYYVAPNAIAVYFANLYPETPMEKPSVPGLWQMQMASPNLPGVKYDVALQLTCVDGYDVIKIQAFAHYDVLHNPAICANGYTGIVKFVRSCDVPYVVCPETPALLCSTVTMEIKGTSVDETLGTLSFDADPLTPSTGTLTTAQIDIYNAVGTVPNALGTLVDTILFADFGNVNVVTLPNGYYDIKYTWTVTLSDDTVCTNQQIDRVLIDCTAEVPRGTIVWSVRTQQPTSAVILNSSCAAGTYVYYIKVATTDVVEAVITATGTPTAANATFAAGFAAALGLLSATTDYVDVLIGACVNSQAPVSIGDTVTTIPFGFTLLDTHPFVTPAVVEG